MAGDKVSVHKSTTTLFIVPCVPYMSSPLLPPAFERGVRRADAPVRAHYGSVFDVAVCPWDESLFATAGEDETARVWRDNGLGSGGGFVSHGVCRGHKDEVVRVAWHPTMTIMASGSADGAVSVWRVAQPGQERTANAHDPDEASVARVDVLGPHPGEVYGCTFVGDGSGGGPVLATTGVTDLRLWDLETATELACVGPMKPGFSGSDAGVNDVKIRRQTAGNPVTCSAYPATKVRETCSRPRAATVP